MNGKTVPGILYIPENAKGQRPLVLMGHAWYQHKKTQDLRPRAHVYNKNLDWAVVAFDAPGHGDRVSPEEPEKMKAQLADPDSRRISPDTAKILAQRSVQAVAEWKSPRMRLNNLSMWEIKEKSMPINPGGHVEIPMSERESWQTFFKRHLGSKEK